MRLRKVLVVLLAAGCTVASLLTPASAVTTGPTIDNSSMMNGGMPCATSTSPALGYFATQLEVLGTDPAPPYGSHFVYSFAIWPQADPSAVTTFSTTDYNISYLARGQVPYGTLSSGTSYAWHVQLTDGNGTSPWSQTCLFSYDYTPPQLPTVTSSNFPSGCCSPGPVGVLPQFTFSGNGDPDTVGFAWAWGDILPAPVCISNGPQGQLICPDPLSVPGVVRADAPGGTASVSQNPPHDGPIDITVAAVDRAGNESQQVTYRLFVPYSGPTVTVTSNQPICGSSTATVSFAPYPGVTGVVSYTYRLDFNSSQSVTVPADQNGLATTTIDVSSQPYAITATSLSSNGFVSSMGYASVDVNPVPTVSADVYQNSGQPVGGPGVAGSFTFSPPFDGHLVTGYRYQFSHGPVRTIAADQNSETAAVQYRPAGPGPETLTVQSLNGDAPGGSCQLSYTFVVAGKSHTD